LNTKFNIILIDYRELLLMRLISILLDHLSRPEEAGCFASLKLVIRIELQAMVKKRSEVGKNYQSFVKSDKIINIAVIIILVH